MRSKRDVVAEHGAKVIWDSHLPEIIAALRKFGCGKCSKKDSCLDVCPMIQESIDMSLWGNLDYHARMN